MGTLIKIDVNGEVTRHEAKKATYEEITKLLGGYMERIKVRYEGKVRDCYLDEEGFIKNLPVNTHVRKLAQDYYQQPCQVFLGPAVIWVP